jgi:AcrR family transcriptional regulator
MPRYRDDEREEATEGTRRLLLKAAAHEFAHEGYDGAKIDQISKSAGFAKGTIYNYFPSKRALMLALIQETAQTHCEMIAGVVLQEQDAIRRIEQFFAAGWSFVAEHLDPGRVMISALYGSDLEFKQALGQGYRPLFELVSVDILMHGIAQGVFREVDVPATTGIIMNLYLALASHADDEGRILIEAEQASDFVKHALSLGSP